MQTEGEHARRSSPRLAAGEAGLCAQLQDALFGLAELLFVQIQMRLRARLVAETGARQAQLVMAFRRVGIDGDDLDEGIARLGVALLLHEEQTEHEVGARVPGGSLERPARVRFSRR